MFWLERIFWNTKMLPRLKEVEDDRKLYLDYYKMMRDYTQHEDSLINQRLGWLITLHGFLYASLALTVHAIVDMQSQAQNNACILNYSSIYVDPCARIEVFVFFICLVGLWVAVSVLRSIQGAIGALRSISRITERTLDRENRSSTSSPAYYTIGKGKNTIFLPKTLGAGSTKSTRDGVTAAKFIPRVIITSWIVISILHLNFSVNINKQSDYGINLFIVAIALFSPFIWFYLRNNIRIRAFMILNKRRIFSAMRKKPEADH
jgi:hypothetical protein